MLKNKPNKVSRKCAPKTTQTSTPKRKFRSSTAKKSFAPRVTAQQIAQQQSELQTAAAAQPTVSAVGSTTTVISHAKKSKPATPPPTTPTTPTTLTTPTPNSTSTTTPTSTAPPTPTPTPAPKFASSSIMVEMKREVREDDYSGEKDLTHWNPGLHSFFDNQIILGKDRNVLEAPRDNSLPYDSRSIFNGYFDIHFDASKSIETTSTVPQLHTNRAKQAGTSILWGRVNAQLRHYLENDFQCALQSTSLLHPTYISTNDIPATSSFTYPEGWFHMKISSQSVPIRLSNALLPSLFHRQIIHWNYHARLNNAPVPQYIIDEREALEKEVLDLKQKHLDKVDKIREETFERRDRKTISSLQHVPIPTEFSPLVAKKEMESTEYQLSLRAGPLEIPQAVEHFFTEPWKHDMVRIDTITSSTVKNKFKVEGDQTYVITVPPPLDEYIQQYKHNEVQYQSDFDYLKSTKLTFEKKQEMNDTLTHLFPDATPLPILNDPESNSYRISLPSSRIKPFDYGLTPSSSKPDQQALVTFIHLFRKYSDFDPKAPLKSSTLTNNNKKMSLNIYKQVPDYMHLDHLFPGLKTHDLEIPQKV